MYLKTIFFSNNCYDVYTEFYLFATNSLQRDYLHHYRLWILTADSHDSHINKITCPL